MLPLILNLVTAILWLGIAQPELQSQKDPLAIGVLVQAETTYTARQVLEKVAKLNPTLLAPLENDSGYREQYLASPLFLDQVRAFSDWLLIEEAELPKVSEQELLQVAKDWGIPRGRSQFPKAILATAGIRVEVEARLLSLTPKEFPIPKLRKRFHKSIPEFYGEFQVSVIRIPMINWQTGRAATQAERKTAWKTLSEIGQDIALGKTTWEEAHLTNSKDPFTKQKFGRMGILKPVMPGKHEPEFLKSVFEGFGITRPNLPLIRGPIMTRDWASLVRLEALNIRGVAEMTAVKDRIVELLRQDLATTRLKALQARVQRKVLVPFPAKHAD